MRYLATLLATASIAAAATGDILSVTVNSDGITADVVVDNLSTGGSYSWGWDATNSVSGSTPKVTFTVVSLGYDATGGATTKTRTIYGTKTTRIPGSSSLNESVAGGDVTIRIALSDYIYAKDKTGAGNSGTAPTVSFGSGWYTQGTASNAVTGLAVTNNSTAAYPKVIGNWNMPPFQRITGNFKLRASAFHRDGQQGTPVRAVKYTVTDESANSVTAWATMTVSNDDGDAVPIPEWIATIDPTTLTQGDVLTCQMQSYPWVGDSDSVLDTSTSGYTQPDARHAPLLLLNDKSGTYGITYAKVDATAPNDTSGQAYPAGSWDYATAQPFLTLAKAARAIRDYNSANRSRDDVGGGVVQIAAGSYSAFGSTQAGGYGSTPETWITFEPGPGVTGTDVIINGDTGDGDISDRVRMKDVKITTTGGSTFTGIGAVWWDGVTIDTTNASLLNPGVHWFTQCSVPALSQGLRPFSTNATYLALVRGCNLTGFNKDTIGHTVIGNLSTSGTPSFHTCVNGQTGYAAQSYILAFNKIMSFDTASRTSYINKAYQYASTYEPQRGSAFVQNMFERLGTDGTTPVSEIASSSTQPSSNVLVWHNTMVGQRENYAYNDTGTTSVAQEYWSLKNNIFWDFNIKSDDFGTPNANRTGNWGPFLGLGWSGNLLADSTNGFDAEWAGFNGDQSNWPNMAWFGFTSYAANTGTGTAGAGGGDYTLTVASPAYNIAVDWVLSHDIAGNVRGATDSAGAFTTYEAPPPAPSTINATSTNATTITIQ